MTRPLPFRTAVVVAVLSMTGACAGGSDTVGLETAPEFSAPTTALPAPATTPEETPVSRPEPTDPTTPATDHDPVTDDSAPATEPSPVASTTSLGADADPCRRVTDFDDPNEGWFIVNDGVMGGQSQGDLDVADSVLRFDGTIVTAGGGFTSIRRELGGGELAGSDRIEMRVRADERIYGLILDDLHEVNGRNVSYRADLDTTGSTDDDGWQIVSIPHASLTPTIFGRVVEAGPFVPDEATEIGIIIADGLDGDFRLDIDWVDACTDT